MRIASPLRYPGGKSTLAPFIAQVRHMNDLGASSIGEPFAGGAGASLSLLYLEETPRIVINDIDKSIHDFWWTLVHRGRPLLKKIQSTRVSIAEWKRQRDIHRRSANRSMLDNAFATFYLNRCNRSGILLNGGPIGGFSQKGKWKLNARYNKPELIRRCEKVREYRERITVSKMDGIEFIAEQVQAGTFLFIDPPYYTKGSTLYLNNLDPDYHANLAKTLQHLDSAPWILTYDDCHEIRNLYKQWANITPYTLRYVAAKKRKGNELLITPKWMSLPDFL